MGRRKQYAYAAYGTIGWFVISLIFLCCCCNRIKLLIAILKAAAQFITDIYSVVLVPPVMWGFLVVYFGWWMWTMLWIYTSGEKDTAQMEGYPFIVYKLSTMQRVQLYTFFFGGLWGIAFLTAVQYFIIASAVCKWYFSHDSNSTLKDDEIGFPIFNAIKRVFRYHLGSLAYGSLILAITWVIRFIVELFTVSLKNKAKTAGECSGAAKAANCLLKCCRCCMGCWDKCLKFLTTQAYIRIALTGEGFCAAAKSAFFVITKNSARYAVVEGLGGFFTLLGTCCIAFSSTYVGYKIIQDEKY